jgi:deoxyhypusine synthase
MAYYAQIVDNIVTTVVVVNDDIADGAQFCTRSTSAVNGNKHILTLQAKTMQRIGDTYDAVNQNFIAPQPYPSWTLGQQRHLATTNTKT